MGNSQHPSPSAPSSDIPKRSSYGQVEQQQYSPSPAQEPKLQSQAQHSNAFNGLESAPSHLEGPALSTQQQHSHSRVHSNVSTSSSNPDSGKGFGQSSTDLLPHNPLVGAASSSWLRDGTGRPRKALCMPNCVEDEQLTVGYRLPGPDFDMVLLQASTGRFGSQLSFLRWLSSSNEP